MTNKLKDVFDKIKNHPIFIEHDFRLVGGTALSYHIKHRLSEDLDFFILEFLPKEDITTFINFCINIYGEEKINYIQPSDGSLFDTAEQCLEPDDMQQDWNINGVKVTFFNASSNIGIEDIFKEDKYSIDGNIKITSVDSIFKMKSLMFYKRIKIRDYFDLVYLYNNDTNFTPSKTFDLIQKYELAYSNLENFNLFFLDLRIKIKSYKEETDAPLYSLIKNPPSFTDLSSNIYKLLEEKFLLELKNIK
jgi:predicted nucleotidyltransferase component of viral defense system